MTPHAATAVLSAIAGAVLATLAVSPVPEVGFVIQAGGVGAPIGTTVAVYRHHHGIHEPELRWLVARWSLAAAPAGLVYTLLTGLL